MTAVAETAVIDAPPVVGPDEQVLYTLPPERLTIASPPAIFAALAAIMRETTAIAKDRTNVQQGFKYRGIDDVYNSIHASFARHGVFTTSKILERLREERVTKTGGSLVLTQLRLEYTFHCCADGSRVATEVWGEGMDSADKSSNKAMAVGHKYALLQMLLIPTDEAKDPDGDSPPPTSPSPRAAQSATQAAKTKAAPPPTPPEPAPQPPKPITAPQHKRLEARINELGLDREAVREWLLIHLGGEDLHLNQMPQSLYAELDSKMEDWAALEHVIRSNGIDRGKVMVWVRKNTQDQVQHLADVAEWMRDALVERIATKWAKDARWAAPQSAPATVEG